MCCIQNNNNIIYPETDLPELIDDDDLPELIRYEEEDEERPEEDEENFENDNEEEYNILITTLFSNVYRTHFYP